MSESWRRMRIRQLAIPSKRLVDLSQVSDPLIRHFSLPAFDVGSPTTESPASIKSAKLEFKREEVLFSKLNPHIPRVWWPRPDSSLRNLASTEFLVLAPTQSITPAFLFHLMRSPQVLDIAKSLVKGTTGSHQRVDVNALLASEVQVPPLEEQKRIAAVLSALDDLSSADANLASNLRASVEALFAGLLQTPCARVPLGEICDFKYGKSLPASARCPGPVPVVSSAGIIDWHDASAVRGPGVVVGRKGTVGSVTWVGVDFFPIDTAFYVETDLPMLFVYFLLKAQALGTMNTDSAVPGLNRGNAMSIRVPLPAADAIATFAHQAWPLWKAAAQLDEEIDQLRATRDELLPLLMSGKVSPGEVAA